MLFNAKIQRERLLFKNWIHGGCRLRHCFISLVAILRLLGATGLAASPGPLCAGCRDALSRARYGNKGMRTRRWHV